MHIVKSSTTRNLKEIFTLKYRSYIMYCKYRPKTDSYVGRVTYRRVRHHIPGDTICHLTYRFHQLIKSGGKRID